MIEESLSSRSALVVAKAAQLAARHRLETLKEPLARAFERFLQAGPSADKGCEAKSALAEALCELEANEEELFLRGLRLVQELPAFGGSMDVAAKVRGLSAISLVRCYRRQVLNDLAEVLCDPEPVARSLAVRAVVENGEWQGGALLKLLLLSGEEVPDVVLEAIAGLFALTPGSAVDFLKRHFLGSSRDPQWPMAVLALGESRLNEALEVLLELYPRQAYSADRKSILEAIALSRLPKGLEFLLGLVEQGERDSEQAAETIEKLWGDEATLLKLRSIPGWEPRA